jgi:asparagine synthase (glutamine-hydrolysing)
MQSRIGQRDELRGDGVVAFEDFAVRGRRRTVMCGICGRYGARTELETLIRATDRLTHRGPDDAGYFQDDLMSLGMRRLSIIDVAGGHQPMRNEDGRINVVFNGEIYNFHDLQTELRALGHTFSSNSDTEVIAHGYEEWGEACFRRFEGIFAVAIWDASRRRCVLARDHIGVKPLYYGWDGNILVFGSELKALVALLPGVPAIDPHAAFMYLRYAYVPCPLSIFEGVSKLPPGHVLTLEPGWSGPKVAPYWRVEEVAEQRSPISTEDDAVEGLIDVLGSAVRRQMISDVPLGAFLSGGMDSSAVVALMQATSNRTVQTFSIGFEESAYDESGYAEEVARHLGTDHHVLIATEAEALEVVPRLPYFYDEPFGDSSAIPTYLVSQLARRSVTVTLSGDGGDELFGGYGHYARMRRIRPYLRVPHSLRELGAWGAKKLPDPIRYAMERMEGVARGRAPHDVYRNLVATLRDPFLARVTGLDGEAYASNQEWPAHLFDRADLDQAMMVTDLLTYLPDDILTKVDRASMANSLEARVPILDPRVVEFVVGLPTSVRVGATHKALLRHVLSRHLPSSIFDRPKKGFGIPQDRWLRTALRGHMLDYLSPESLLAHGLLDPAAVTVLVQQHLHGTRDWGYILWDILMFQMWFRAMPETFSGHQSTPRALVEASQAS